MNYIAKTLVGKKHVFCININYDKCKWNYTFFKKKPIDIEEQIREIILRRG